MNLKANCSSVTSVGDLIELIAERIYSDKRVLWFRGHRSSAWTLAPRIWRDYDKEQEKNFTNRFRSRAASMYLPLPDYDNSAIWPSLMQHYGLPTRLLDLTRSPLIAAYFALEVYFYDPNCRPEDALIWILEPHTLNSLECFEDITPSIDAHMCEKMLKPAFTHDAVENNKVLAVMAAEMDIRLFVQQDCFTNHWSQTPLNERIGHINYLSCIKLPADSVLKVAFEIDVCGFRKGDIFPDLGHLADELRERRSPPPNAAYATV
jgi:FRG domain